MVSYPGSNPLASRLGRFVRHFFQTSALQTCSMFLLIAPVLLLASPQRTGENSVHSVAAAEGKSEAFATNFPQLPYQGSPAALPQDQGTPGLRLSLRRLGTTARMMQVVAHP